MQPEDKLLPLLRGVVPEGPGKWRACCPIHNGGNEQHPSLGITKADDGKLLLHCFVCGPAVKSPAFCMQVGITQSELYPEDIHKKHAGQSKSKPRGKIVEKYDYFDRDGVLIYQACRLDPKDFRQRRPNGSGGWVWNLRGVTRILYRLPQLIAADPAQPVFIVEGERKVDRLAALGFIATCNVGGAGKWKQEYGHYFTGRDVIILPDNDTPGAEHAAKITLSLSGISRSVKTVNLPGMKTKGDVVDWLNAGGTAAGLRELCKSSAAPPADLLAGLFAARPASDVADDVAVDDPLIVAKETEVLKELRLDVLGELDGTGGHVKVFSEDHRKSDVIRDVSKMSYERLAQICGPIVKSKIAHSADDKPEGMYTIADVRRAISLLSGYRRIGEDTELGVGCWQGLDETGALTDSVILVGAGEAAKWNGPKQLERITKPRIGGRLLDIGGSDGWYDHAELARTLDECTPEAAADVVKEATEFFERWKWKHAESPLVISGLILATWIQTIWAWRPQVAVVGKSNTGKSTLFEALEGIFGRLAVKSSKSSAAGIRQSIRRSAKIALCDEFESGRHRDEILEMIRASSRGDKVLRGTAGHKGQEFVLRHIVWIAAIESGLKREPDRNRFISLELIPPTDALAGKLVCPPASEMGRLGQRLLAVSIRHGIQARELAVELKGCRFDGIHPRVIESYSVPAAIVAGLLGLSGDDAAGILERMLRTVDRGETSADDESLLGDILSSTVELSKSERGTVGQAIEMDNRGSGFSTSSDHALNQVGLCYYADETLNTDEGPHRDDWLFVAHLIVTRKLLKDTTWAQQNIDQILARIPKAVRTRRRFAGQNNRGVMIPSCAWSA
jgi:plasmid stabilization system protein ParE/5S rRNA maturation endonuclease (ribonuclease M5)